MGGWVRRESRGDGGRNECGWIAGGEKRERVEEVEIESGWEGTER